MSYLSAAGVGAENQDFVAAVGQAVVVLDGATPEPHIPDGCRHGVAAYVRMLGLRIVDRLARDTGNPLAQLLERAIGEVRDGHSATCDLANPYTPSATVAMLRGLGEHIEYLVLGDCAVVLRLLDSRLRVTLDDRLARLPASTGAARARLRNRDGGFWVAGALPAAAHHAIVGRVPVASVSAAALLTDGAYRLVSDFGMNWAQAMTVLETTGPAGLIARTRRAELTADLGERKRHDDATAALCRIGESTRC
jgi:hypothetical protein